MGGHDSGIIDNTQVRIIAQEYTPIDEDIIPTGEIKKVENTDMDLAISHMIIILLFQIKIVELER